MPANSKLPFLMAACLVPEPTNKGNHEVQFNTLVPGNRLKGDSLFAGMAASYVNLAAQQAGESGSPFLSRPCGLPSLRNPPGCEGSPSGTAEP
jgi:hypothetical protein